MKVRENKYKIILVSEQLIGQFLFAKTVVDDFVKLIDNDLPGDIEVVAIQYDFARDSFAFKIWHESFDIVPSESVLPTLVVTLRQYHLALTEEQKQEIDQWTK